jgi:hypothetical protein
MSNIPYLTVTYDIYVKIIYADMGVESPISFGFSGISFVFPMCFEPDEDHLQIK